MQVSKEKVVIDVCYADDCELSIGRVGVQSQFNLHSAGEAIIKLVCGNAGNNAR